MGKPDFSFEGKYWKEGIEFVIGVDEVGRGPLAGPVVAEATMLKSEIRNPKSENNLINEIIKLGINDSKKLTAKKRELLSEEIPKYFRVGIGKSSVSDINKLGIVRATEKAMTRAINNLIAQSQKSEIRISKKIINSNNLMPNNLFLLIDGLRPKYYVVNTFGQFEAIVKGDEKSISIAAASIMAKVYRDRLMVRLAKKYPDYGWEKNKGYGTRKHIEAIRKYGLTKYHRDLFVDGIINSKFQMPRSRR
jgi:ribonuclease HII